MTLFRSIAGRLAGRSAVDDGSIALLRRLFSDNFRDYASRYALALGLMLVTAATTSLSAWLMRDVVNEIFVEQNHTLIWFFGWIVIAISVIKGFSIYGQTVVLSRIGNSLVARLQRRMFDKMLQLGVGYYSQQHSSQIITRINHNAAAARDAMNLIATSFGRDLITVVGLVTVMIVTDPLMAFFSLLIAPPVIWFVVRLVKRVRKLAAQEINVAAAVIGLTQDVARGIRIIKSFTLEDPMRKRVDVALRNVEKRANKMASLQASTGPMMEALGGVVIGIVIMYAGWQTVAEGQTPGEFMAFLTAFLLAYEPAKRLTRFHVNLERYLVGIRLMYEFLDQDVEEGDQARGRDLGTVRGDVALKDVVFGYEGEEPVLKGVSIEARKGEVVALVGPSGGGKTTIISLVQRFFRPWSGQVLVDDNDVQDVSLNSLRRHTALVSQDTFLFTGTVRENIAMGRQDCTKEDIVEAAQAAQAWGFISRLPKGLDTEIGENGVQLSGGQRQRLAIARAVLKGAPILLLDEATSALDTESERKVQAALDDLMSGRTTIVIAHRLSTILKADRIYVIQDGSVVETGTHESLLAEGGVYANLYGSDALDVTDDLALTGTD